MCIEHKEYILFAPHHDRLPVFLNLIKALSSKFHIVICITSRKNDCDIQMIKQIESLGAKIFYHHDTWGIRFLNKVFFGKRSIKANNSLKQIALKYAYMLWYEFESRYMSKMLTKYNIKCLISQDDLSIYYGVGFRVAAKKLGIPIVLPYLYTTGYYLDPLYKNPKYWLKSNLCWWQTKVFNKFQKNGYENAFYKEHSYYTAFVLEAQYNFHKVLSKNPWFNGSGLSDIVVIDSYHTYKKFENIKEMNMDKIRILGSISDDEIFNSYKNKEKIQENFIKKYNLNTSKKTLIYSVPCYFEHGFLKSHEEVRSFIKKLVANTREVSQANIILALHPRMEFDEYEFLDKELNCTIPNESLAEYISIADVFIADFSSTVLWATLCGIKSLIICAGSFSIDFFEDFESILFAKNFDDFREKLKYLLENDISFSNDWKLLSRNEVFDGKTKERYVNLVKNLSKR